MPKVIIASQPAEGHVTVLLAVAGDLVARGPTTFRRR
jgi:hypothetical protein